MKNKLLNFTICQLLVVIVVLLPCLSCESQQSPGSANVTYLNRSFEKVLSRRKRFLVWRPGSNLLLTASLVKPLAFPRPGGHNLILEWDIFYPLPSTWRLPTPPTPPPTPPPETTTEEVYYDHHDHDHHGHDSSEIWAPESGWNSDVIETLSANKDAADKRYWNSLQPPQRRTDGNQNDLFLSPTPSTESQYNNPLLFPRPWQPKFHSQTTNSNPQFYQSNLQSPLSSSAFYNGRPMTMREQRRQTPMRKGRSLNSASSSIRIPRKSTESTDDDWGHYHAHRDRRELYRKIENSSPFGSFDVKSCLLRTICEARSFLYPPGYSLLQDMIRAIFTMPVDEGADDDYRIALQAKDQDCLSFYSQKCPMSILAFLLRSKS